MNFFQITLAICLLQLTTSAENQVTFSVKLFDRIASKNLNKNTIISPASIQTALALVYLGAEGKTAKELRQGLHLGNSSVSKEQVAKQFANLMNKMRSSTKATVKMANRIYVRKDLKLAAKFNDVAQRYFDSSAESVNFSENMKTAERINNWIEQQTENKIQNVISSHGINAGTDVILVNAIYFKAEWLKTFVDTSVVNFHVSKIKTKKVKMMYQKGVFAYAELKDLNTKALSLKYVGTDIQMLILLPNDLDGLRRLEKQLRFDDLRALIRKLKSKHVHLFLPKFKFEFDVSLVSALKALGIQKLFSPSSANISSLLTNGDNVAVSDVVHKAFIEVNEKGTVAAAATATEFYKFSSIQDPPPLYVPFYVDHPFYFALMDNDTVYFAGHVVNI